MSVDAFQDKFRGAGEFEPVAAPLYGLRQWRLQRISDRDFRLVSTFLHMAWLPDVNTACCLVNLLSLAIAAPEASPETAAPARGHSIPGADCQCGLWAYSPPAGTAAELQMTAGRSVVGVVEAWGRVVVGTLGFRAEKARIRALAFPSAGATDPGVATSPSYTVQHKLTSLLELCCDDDCGHGPPTGHWEAHPPDVSAALARAYPDAAQFRTIEQMLAEFPLTDLAALAGGSS